MATELRLKNCRLDAFRNTFQSRKEYQTATAQMSLKERLVDWKATNAFELNLQEHLRDQALFKVGSGCLQLTSYLLSENPNECRVYVSYGGMKLCLTKEGREDDVGFFITAWQDGDDVKLSIIHKDQFYKFRARIRDLICVVIGFICFLIPGVLFICFLVFVRPRIFRKKIQTNIVPVLLKTFEGKHTKATPSGPAVNS